MPEYILKPGQERFQVVDGPFENRSFLPGVIYSEIPPEEAHKFDDVSAPVVSGKKSKSSEVENA